jgi:hypothetical protein
MLQHIMFLYHHLRLEEQNRERGSSIALSNVYAVPRERSSDNIQQ